MLKKAYIFCSNTTKNKHREARVHAVSLLLFSSKILLRFSAFLYFVQTFLITETFMPVLNFDGLLLLLQSHCIQLKEILTLRSSWRLKVWSCRNVPCLICAYENAETIENKTNTNTNAKLWNVKYSLSLSIVFCAYHSCYNVKITFSKCLTFFAVKQQSEFSRHTAGKNI